MAVNRGNLQDRYELKEVLGRGGMGVVYRAFDTLMKRDVALKTIIDIDNPATLQLFYKEWSILATMVHPNVVNIYDIGELQQNGVKQPFFVMPLLLGLKGFQHPQLRIQSLSQRRFVQKPSDESHAN